MIAARHSSECPGCSEPIEPGDSIGKIGLAYYCSECVGEFERDNRHAQPTKVPYPMSGVYEQDHSDA